MLSLAAEADADGRFADAATIYGQAISEMKTPPAWLYVRQAQSMLRAGDRNGAISAYEQAVSLHPREGWKTALEELLRWGYSKGGSLEASSSYYDEIYRHSEEYAKTGEDTSYKAMWEKIVEIISASKSKSVLDIGSGPGQFAAFLLSRYKCSYHGLDFSDIAVEQARAKGLPASFDAGDALTSDLLLSDYDVVVCTEVLEHIDDDLKLVGRIRPGTLVLFSVPSFYAFGHVRYFKSAEPVYERYAHLFHDFSVENFGLPSGETIFLLSGRVKG
jgi:2-polyprenyl-3-methyl-5-hydroxy-6-metoxy-1,4-benzoquinol methylase